MMAMICRIISDQETCEIPRRLGGKRNILYEGVETSPFNNLEGKPSRENPKRTIFASGGLGMLPNLYSWPI